MVEATGAIDLPVTPPLSQIGCYMGKIEHNNVLRTI